jgi:hypothetical protein
MSTRPFLQNQHQSWPLFRRELLPPPAQYYRNQGLKLTGGGIWKKARCPCHKDKKPSLLVRLDSGGFRCTTCGIHGGDVLAFHRKRYELEFAEAAKQLGAWGWDYE